MGNTLNIPIHTCSAPEGLKGKLQFGNLEAVWTSLLVNSGHQSGQIVPRRWQMFKRGGEWMPLIQPQ